MASAAPSSKSVDESLWWDSFVQLSNYLDSASSLSHDLAEKLKKNHRWFLESVTCFRPPNELSRQALDSSEINIGEHRLVVKERIKEAALKVSKYLCLDEVQSYILASRYFEFDNFAADIGVRDFPDAILMHYYLERQSLLHCIRSIFVHALHVEYSHQSANPFNVEALQLVKDGLENKLVSTFKDLFLSVHSEITDVDLAILWVEEILIENNLLLEILFIAYYDNNFSSCKYEQWKTLCSLFKSLFGSLDIGKVAVSVEANHMFGHAKTKLLLILIETLDLENLLQMINDEIPLRQGLSVFSLKDISEIDAEITSISELGVVEVGPLLLAWAVFLRLVMSLPEANDAIFLMEVNHIGYVRQAYELGSFDFILEILQDDAFKDSNGPLTGFLSVLRTFISAFIASYEISYQTEGQIFSKALDIICEIYSGEETLCMQFWDRDSFVDEPIRSLLLMLEKDYPLSIAEFIHLLSAFCEGSWSARCVYNYLDKMSGITTLYKAPSSFDGMRCNDIIEVHDHLQVPFLEGVVIPKGTFGHVTRVIDANTAFVRWECPYSGIWLLLLKLMSNIHSDTLEDVFPLVDLLYRLVYFNKDVCFLLMDFSKSVPVNSKVSLQFITDTSVNLVQVACTLISKLVQDVNNAQTISVCFNILTEILKCAPSHVMLLVSKSNVIATEISSISSGVCMLSGGLAKMLMDAFGNGSDSLLLTTSVVDFTIQLLEKGAEDALVFTLIVFSLQFVFVNHMNWRYKSMHARWKLTLKAFEVMKSCIKATNNLHKLHDIFWDIMLHDASVHITICRIICISAKELRSFVREQCKLKDLECLQLAICSAYDVVHSILDHLSQENFCVIPAFLQTMLSPSTKPVPVFAAAASLVSFSENTAIQISAAKTVSLLCLASSRLQSYKIENTDLVLDADQIKELRHTICSILNKDVVSDEDLTIAIFDLLSSCACCQPALFSSLMMFEEPVEEPQHSDNKAAGQNASVSVARLSVPARATAGKSILRYAEGSEDLYIRTPRLLLSYFNLLKVIWEGGVQYSCILEDIRSSKELWAKFSSVILSTQSKSMLPLEAQCSVGVQPSSFRFRCRGMVLQIMAHELFLSENMIRNEASQEQTSNTVDSQAGSSTSSRISKFKDVLYAQEVLPTLFDNPKVVDLVISFSAKPTDEEIIFSAKLAACAFVVHLILKLESGDAGSLSISFIKKISSISEKLLKHPMFSLLLAQYSSRGYSEKKESSNLIINDLYYHIRGELKGREIVHGPFRELLYFLLDLQTFEQSKQSKEKNHYSSDSNICLFDIPYIRDALGIELWDHSDWIASKEIAEDMFAHMHEANMIVLLLDSKQYALKSLISVTLLYNEHLIRRKEIQLQDRLILRPFIESGVGYLCDCLQQVVDSLLLVPKPTEVLLRIYATKGELLLSVCEILFVQGSFENKGKQLLPLALVIIRKSSSAIKVLSNLHPLSPMMRRVLSLLLTLLLTSYQFTYRKAKAKNNFDEETKLFEEVSFLSIGLLPALCMYSEDNDYTNLCIATIDIMLNGFLAVKTWFPILKKHLPLPHILQKVRESDTLVSVTITLNFLLTYARTKDGARALYFANFFTSLKVILGLLKYGALYSENIDQSNIVSRKNDERDIVVMSLSFAIITAVICYIDDDSLSADFVASVICYFFYEMPHIISFGLSALNYPAEDSGNKRARIQNLWTSCTALKLTEHTLELVSVLVGFSASWSIKMKEIDSELRETMIHILAFISKGSMPTGDSPHRSLPLLCHPTTKEEFEFKERPSVFQSRHGWFNQPIVGCLGNSTVSAASDRRLTVLKDKNQTPNLDPQTYFSDIVAIHIYRIASLLLNFLYVQAKAAVQRADKVDFIDLAHFPELPMPEILHGLQDQAIAIVTELCGTSRRNQFDQEKENVCLLLLQILEKSFYLELCVIKSYGIRPVLGRVEDLSKDMKALINAIEHHGNFGPTQRSLKQILILMYPGLLQISHHI